MENAWHIVSTQEVFVSATVTPGYLPSAAWDRTESSAPGAGLLQSHVTVWSTAWMKTQKSWLSRVRMGGPTKDAWVSEDLLPPLTRAASRSGPGAPGPALTVNVRRERCCFTSSSQSLCRLPLVAQAAHAEIQLNQADTWVHYSPPVDLAPIHIHSVCVCVAVPCGTQDVSSRPGIKPVPPAMDMQRANHWTTGECQCAPLFNHN